MEKANIEMQIEQFFIEQENIQYQELQTYLDNLIDTQNIELVNCALVKMLLICIQNDFENKKKYQIEALLSDDESIFNMAVRLLYAQTKKENLDNLPCLEFINNIDQYINTVTPQKTVLLKEPYIEHVLPLLPLLVNKPITLLNLGGKKLTKFPKKLCFLKNLNTLYLHNNKISTIPINISFLNNLQVINLSQNCIEIIPDEFCNLQNLISLNLTFNQILELPIQIGNLENLQELILTSNNLCELPESIGNLEKLEELTLWGNRLTQLPLALQTLPYLKELKLWNNPLSTLPSWLEQVLSPNLSISIDFGVEIPTNLKKYESYILVNGKYQLNRSTNPKIKTRYTHPSQLLNLQKEEYNVQ